MSRCKLRLILIALVMVLASVPDAAAAEPASIQFVGPQSLSPAIESPKNQTKPFSVWLSNNTSIPLTPTFEVLLENKDGEAVAAHAEAVEKLTIPPDHVGRIRVVVSGLSEPSASGQLVAIGTGVGSASVTLSVAPAPTYKLSSTVLLLVPGVIALVLVAICSAYLGLLTRLKDTLRPADLDFSSGFSSTLTLVGALLGVIVSASVIPEETIWLSKDTYIALNIIFGALIALSALVYGAYQTEEDGEPHGHVGTFLAAAALTTWAAFGELATIWFLVWDINGTSGLTPGGTRIMDAILIFGGLLMLLYVASSIKQITASPKALPHSRVRSARAAKMGLL
jgi:hypothetical protein